MESPDRAASQGRVAVVGGGYVGLPLALLLAKAGRDVAVIDTDQAKVDAINGGTWRGDEADLNALLADLDVRSHLTISATASAADIFVIAVPTPTDKRKKVADLGSLEAALRSLVPVLRRGNLVIVESTVPPLTTRDVVTPILESSGLKVGTDLLVAHCPERVLPGNTLHEMVHNDRLIGGTTPEAVDRAAELYRVFVEGDLLITDATTAELSKLAENSYRDLNIAFANELAAVAEGIDVDPLEVIRLANRHPRVNIHQPGIGVGGHCLPLDPWFIKEVDADNTTLISAARLVNDGRPARIASRIRQAVKAVPDPRIVAVGATYKPNVSDARESPAAEVVHLLRVDGYAVVHVDPHVPAMAYQSLAAASHGADCLVILVEHDRVRTELDADGPAIRSGMRTPIVLRFYQAG
jgi:UDP-N-acetyl-D-mannosaminuronic acid dehydrogenase